MPRHARQTFRCSFCGKNQTVVHRLIAGPSGIYICDECVNLCNEILSEEEKAAEIKPALQMNKVPTPKQIYEQLSQYVIGQERAKKTLSVAVYNHYKRINPEVKEDDDVEIGKSNILLIGPTGSGKTLLAQTLARILDVPFSIADATALTEAGYVGEDVENILLRLIQAADGDITRAERGIIYIDEIDKITRKSDNPSITRDVSGEGVQQALLKIIEGTQANVPPQGGRKHPHQDFLQINTANILFICGGAFEGLAKIVEHRVGTNKAMGFRHMNPDEKPVDEENILVHLNPDDLLKYGLIPEFIGRLPVQVSLDMLDKSALVRILTEPKNAIVKQYEKLLQMDKVELSFTSDALLATAEGALKQKTGARGLRSIIESALLDVMYDLPSRTDIKKVVINAGVIEAQQKPLLIPRVPERPVVYSEPEEESA